MSLKYFKEWSEQINQLNALNPSTKYKSSNLSPNSSFVSKLDQIDELIEAVTQNESQTDY